MEAEQAHGQEADGDGQAEAGQVRAPGEPLRPCAEHAVFYAAQVSRASSPTAMPGRHRRCKTMQDDWAFTAGPDSDKWWLPSGCC